MRKVLLVIVGLLFSASFASALGIREYVREYERQLQLAEQRIEEQQEMRDEPLPEVSQPADEEPDDEEPDDTEPADEERDDEEPADTEPADEERDDEEPDDQEPMDTQEPDEEMAEAFTPPTYGDRDINQYRVVLPTVQARLLGRYETGLYDESAAEIVVFDPVTNVVGAINASNGSVHGIDISDPTNPRFIGLVTAAMGGLSGSPNSIAVHPESGRIAVVLEAENPQDPGTLIIGDRAGILGYLNDGTIPPVPIIQTGALPDMVTFSPDGRYVLVANEGEPSDDYSVDPEGSVTIVDLQGDMPYDVSTATFSEDLVIGEEVTGPVRINGPGASFAQDLEPEYIAVDSTSTYAFVALQENNAGALIHIPTGQTIAIASLGTKAHLTDGEGLDPSDRDGYAYIRTFENLVGMYQPDGIDVFTVDGVDYLITANEGDGREYDNFTDEARLGDLSLDSDSFTAQQIEDYMKDEHLGRLTVSTTDGDTDGDGDIDVIHAFGGRSATIWNTRTGEQVWDSGDAFEVIAAALVPQFFNVSNDGLEFDSRSDAKGPEPEGVEIGYWGDRVLAFIGLERQSAIAVFDVTNPHNPIYQTVISTRNYAAATDSDGDYVNWQDAGDLGPEGLLYVAPSDSPTGNALLIVGYEVSGTVAICELMSAMGM